MTKKPSMKHRGEDAAAAYLERVGLCVIERSWQSEAGSIDIVALEAGLVVLVDVKTSRAARQTGGEFPSATLVQHVPRLAKAYLEQAKMSGTGWRLDQIEILVISEDRALLRHRRDVLNLGV